MSNTSSRISKRNNTSILTIGESHNLYAHYEVKHNFNINKLNNISDDYIPFEFKSLILQAYELAQVKTLEDLFVNKFKK